MENDKKTYPRVLTIAGSDSGGGAGIQADIKAISATGSYAASAITAITVQNTTGVKEVLPLPPKVVSEQIEYVIKDIGVDAIKIGMLHSVQVIESIRNSLDRCELPLAPRNNIVIDPVMISTSGHRLIEQDAIEALVTALIPSARIITPNIPEAETLSGLRIQTHKDMMVVGKHLARKLRVSVLMKAGHSTGKMVNDILFNAEEDDIVQLISKRTDTVNTHGTGCTLSSALASYLAQGLSLTEATRAAKAYITKAIESGAQYRIGHGHGPVNHFWRFNQRNKG
ncbi:MAG: bifunctional hydroxymethylpyrimidine kinase/phosphomethylpyrimidine kinase [Bacteroidaceae bacterium]|nr:bifunctional hydroxymethylpyrimidine kinase/phosphomethylpyrimidine kinase [Bacteroidaceae bacterium]